MLFPCSHDAVFLSALHITRERMFTLINDVVTRSSDVTHT